MKQQKAYQILANAKRIGIVRTDKIGDIILTLPMLSPLKEINPEAEIIIIANSYVKPVLDCTEAVFEAKYIGGNQHSFDDIIMDANLDVVFFPRPRLDEALSAFRAGIQLRIGSAYRFYSILFNHTLRQHRKSSMKHEAQHNLDLISSATGTSYKPELINIKPKDYASDKVSAALNSFGVVLNLPFFIVHPGSGGSAYELAPEKFASAANSIYEQSGLIPVISGSKGEFEKCNIVHQLCQNSINLCGTLNLYEMIAIISKCSFIMVNSTGILHIASAMQKPLIGFYPNTLHISPSRWGPLSADSIVITPPTAPPEIRDKMELIKVEDIVSCALKLIKQNL